MKCRVEFVRPAVGLRHILNFEINFITTAGLRGMKCGVEIVRPAVGLRQILSVISGN